MKRTIILLMISSCMICNLRAQQNNQASPAMEMAFKVADKQFEQVVKDGIPILTSEERKYAIDQLQLSKTVFLNAIKGLSAAQLSFKPAPDKWCINEVAEHLTLAEIGIWQIIEQTLKAPADPSKRSDIKVTDEDIRKILTNRTVKTKSPDQIKPTGKFPTATIAAAVFTKRRDATIEFINITQDDLRNRYWQNPATGVIDLYQSVLLISAHCERGVAQIEEVKMSEGFPVN